MRIRHFNPKKSIYKSWDEVFQHPRQVMVKGFQTGTVTINKKGTLNPKHPRAKDIADEELEVPIIAHWVHHELLGDYLLDAGLDAQYYQDKKGGLLGSQVDEFHQKENESIAHHLAQHKINPRGVFFSHLHADHAAGVRELPSNILYVAGKGEYEEYNSKISGNYLEGMEDLQIIDFTHAEQIFPLGACADLLGDGSLWAVWTPGHTPGHMSFLVNGYDKPTFLTMDAAFIEENLKQGVAPSDYTWDVELAQKTLDKIIEFIKIYPQVRVWVGHECPIP